MTCGQALGQRLEVSTLWSGHLLSISFMYTKVLLLVLTVHCRNYVSYISVATDILKT